MATATKQSKAIRDLEIVYGDSVVNAGVAYCQCMGEALRESLRNDRDRMALDDYRQKRRDAWDTLVWACGGSNQLATFATTHIAKALAQPQGSKAQKGEDLRR